MTATLAASEPLELEPNPLTFVPVLDLEALLLPHCDHQGVAISTWQHIHSQVVPPLVLPPLRHSVVEHKGPLWYVGYGCGTVVHVWFGRGCLSPVPRARKTWGMQGRRVLCCGGGCCGRGWQAGTVASKKRGGWHEEHCRVWPLGHFCGSRLCADWLPQTTMAWAAEGSSVKEEDERFALQAVRTHWVDGKHNGCLMLLRGYIKHLCKGRWGHVGS